MYVTNYFMVLDIETSTISNEKDEPQAVWLSYGYCNLYNINGDTFERCYFRDWYELDNFFALVSTYWQSKTIMCFVHNLAYEFDFLIKNISRAKNFLTNSTHNVISAILERFPKIEFRCTLRLTMKSLRKLGAEMGYDKLESDYRLITPKDTVTEEEKQYCIRDCDVVAKYVSQYLVKEYKSLVKIPFTKTGRVRKIYNQFYMQYKKTHKDIQWDLYPDEDCYQAMCDAFAGGITISNPTYTGRILTNLKSFDITSSYPFAQLSEEFPYCIRKEKGQCKKSYLKEKFWIAKIKFNNIHSKYDWGWLSISKMQDYEEYGSSWFNGKLISSKYCVRTITNVDYEILCKTYSFSSIEILEFYHMEKWGRIPEPYINTILKFGILKGDLKNECKKYDEVPPDLEIAYANAKADFNSIYGMTVQKLLQQEYQILENYSWQLKDGKYEQKEGHLKRNFLFGVYTTAYARRNLINAILENCPYTFVYADTDSIKFFGDISFVDTNKQLPQEFASIPQLSKLGRFDNDGNYKYFITWGAKKYAYIDYNSDKVHLTVAGLPKIEDYKKLEIVYNNEKITNFKLTDFIPNTLFKNCKLGKKYITSNVTYDSEDLVEITNMKPLSQDVINYMDKNGIKSGGGVALYPTSYMLDITFFDKNYINEIRQGDKIWLKKLTETSGINIENYIVNTIAI